MTAIIENLGFEVDAIDAFCGWGGSSEGIVQAGATLRACANHNGIALKVHGNRFQQAEHYQCDLVDEASPFVIDLKGKKVPGRYMDPADLPRARLAWFSPSCFPAGTLILTKRGLVPIEDVKFGDEVWTHMQRWRPVIDAMVRFSDTVIVNGAGIGRWEVTANHGVWARRDGGNLARRPYRDGPAPCENCGKPAPPAMGSKTKVLWYCDRKCNQEASNRRTYYGIGDVERVEAGDLAGSWWATPTGIHGMPLPKIPAAVDWWWLGRWVGDGWTGSGRVTICCGRHEVVSMADRLPGWSCTEKPTTFNFTLGNARLVEWLNEHFSQGAARKKIPTWLLALPVCDQQRFLDGYTSADGHRQIRGNAAQVSCVTVSKALALGIRLVAANLGFSPSMTFAHSRGVQEIQGRSVHTLDQWVVTWWEDTTKRPKTRVFDERLWGRVAYVSPGRQQVPVYNITVEEDHTYVADGIVVFNCTHHSSANAKKVYERGLQQAMWEDPDWDEQEFVNSERSRVTMSCVLRYTERHHPEIVCVENVLEVTMWGPGKDGSTFKWWMSELRKIGYEVKCLFLNSMFFAPCPQSRDRLYIVAWRKGNRAPDLDYRPAAFCVSDACGGRMVEAIQTWKPATAAWRGMEAWGKYLSQYRYTCGRCRAPVHPASWMALSALDLSDLGPKLGERKELPAQNTMERIHRAVRKFWNASPVLLPAPGLAGQVETAHSAHAASVNGGSEERYAANRSKLLSDALPALTRRNATAIVTLAGLPMRSGRDRSTVLAGGHGGTGGAGALVALMPNRTNNQGHHAGEATAPVLTSATQGVIVAAAGNTYDRAGDGGYVRARQVGEALFSQTQTLEFGLASVPVLRGNAVANPEERHVAGQTGTLTASGGHHALVTASFGKINGGPADTAWRGVWESLQTVTQRDTHGLVLLPRELWIDQWHSDPVSWSEQLAVVTTHMRHSLASIEPFEGEITDEMLMEVRFRMLKPDPELRRASAFPDDFDFMDANRSQITAGLGAAVTPPPATWIIERCLATLRTA